MDLHSIYNDNMMHLHANQYQWDCESMKLKLHRCTIINFCGFVRESIVSDWYSKVK